VDIRGVKRKVKSANARNTDDCLDLIKSQSISAINVEKYHYLRKK
jgi:hypothetical protein